MGRCKRKPLPAFYDFFEWMSYSEDQLPTIAKCHQHGYSFCSTCNQLFDPVLVEILYTSYSEKYCSGCWFYMSLQPGARCKCDTQPLYTETITNKD